MLAAVNERYGPPEVVQVVDVPDPVPAADELLVRVQLTTVNRTDCAYRRAYPFFMRAVTGLTRPRRTVLGTEYAGEVVGVGAGVTAFAVGDRVFGYCEGRFGAHAQLLTVGERSSVARVPEGVDLRAAAASTEGLHYARSSLRRAGVQVGHRVLVIGATGGIGSAAVQLLAQQGAEVAAVCGSEHVDLVRGLGAGQVVDRFADDFTRLDQTFDVVFDAVGKSSFGECRHLLTPRGRYVSSDLGPGWQNLPLAVLTPALRQRLVVFPFPEDGRHVVQEIADLLATGAFRPLIDRTYPLTQIVEAYCYVETGQKIGNVLVTPGNGR